MEQDIRTFLRGFSAPELRKRGVLRGDTYLLQITSVKPLIELMKEHGVTRLVAEERNWFLNSDGTFSDLGWESPFAYQNTHINPYYLRSGQEPSDDPTEAIPEIQESDNPEQIKFGLERDLQRALRLNINQLEQGLKIIDGGNEKSVVAGRIDITAEDNEGRLEPSVFR